MQRNIIYFSLVGKEKKFSKSGDITIILLYIYELKSIRYFMKFSSFYIFFLHLWKKYWFEKDDTWNVSRISGLGQPLQFPHSATTIEDEEEEQEADVESEDDDDWEDVHADDQNIPDPDGSDNESGREDEYDTDDEVVRLVIKLFLILIFKEINWIFCLLSPSKN